MNGFLDVIAFPMVLAMGVLPPLLLVVLVIVITAIIRRFRNKKK